MNSATKNAELAKASSQSLKLSLSDFLQLTKPTISLLVVVTVLPSLLLAQQVGLPKMSLVVWTLIGTWMASASAAVLNQIVDRDIDIQMARTRKRPLPSGRVSDSVALLVAMLMALGSFLLLNHFASPMAAWVAVAGNIFYVVIYTMILKRRTVQNIVIGGAAGAVGPLIGWAAVTGEFPAWPAWVLFGLIFLWTPPHFWALALKYKNDYAEAGIPMMPVVKGENSTRNQILFYSLLLIPTVASLYFGGQAGLVYLVTSMLLTGYFVYLAYDLHKVKTLRSAMMLFHYSCFYLFGVFGALAADSILFHG